MSDEHIEILRGLREEVACNICRPERKQRTAALDAAIAALGGGWLPIESAPKDGRILAADLLGGVGAREAGYVHALLEDAKREGEASFFTHWMPLPAPPSKEG